MNSIHVDYKDSLLVRNCGESSIDSSSRGDLKSTSSNGLDKGSGCLQYNTTQTLVYHWPSLEKIERFGASHLDSKSAFVMFSPTMHVDAGNILYFWVGRSFSCDASQVLLDSDRESDFLGAIAWNRIGCDVLARLNLPKSTIIKVWPYLSLIKFRILLHHAYSSML